MEKILKIFKYVDGVNDIPFPDGNHLNEIYSFNANSQRMGAVPTIDATMYYPDCLDNLWGDNVYTVFNNERYFLKNTPSSSYSSERSQYKHDLVFQSERAVLYKVYFYDVVTGNTENDKPVSNSSDFVFFGDIHQFASRLNYSLRYAKLDYRVVVDDFINTDSKNLSFQNKFFMEVLQESYNTFGVPYYFVGKEIHIGYTNNVVAYPFKYGVDNELISISKSNANFKVINRCTGTGSADNIPYYYPNDYESKKEVEEKGGTWINPQKNLMPPIYRETFGGERFYNAKNDTYLIPGTNDYYQFEREYEDGRPSEQIVTFEDIKPSIVGIKNAMGQGIDSFVDFAYDKDDNDEVDKDGNFLHPYFFAKFRKFNGNFGFNLFDHAIDEGEMTISMTSGPCGACNWIIGVDDQNKNPVQVDGFGNLKRDEKGNVITKGKPQEIQNDTKNHEVWVALKKDIQTFGVVVPNVQNNYKPKAGDTFVILHIDLPKAYILAAEGKLKDEILKYMAQNSMEKFKFSIRFSRIFLEENPDILAMINENARLNVEYNKKVHTLYVSSFTYRMSDNEALPEITVELSDTLTISRSSLEEAISSVLSSNGVFGGMGGDLLANLNRFFLRKDTTDATKFLIKFLGGAEFGLFRDGVKGAKIDSEGNIKTNKVESHGFNTGVLGTGFQLKNDPDTHKSYLEVDNLFVRLKAFFTELEIRKLSYAGGNWVFSPGGAKCAKVVDMGDFYRCYFVAEDGETKVKNEFRVDDQVRCQEFNVEEGVNQNVSNRYYWRLCVGTGKDYIDLSKSDCDEFSDAPEVGDDMVVLGNRTDATRQNAIVISAYGEGSPSFTQHQGINSYSLANTEKTRISPQKNKFTGEFIFSTTQTNAEDEIKGAKQEAADAKAKADSSEQVANSAKERLNQWADDGYISPTEKTALKQELENLKAEKNEIVNDAEKYTVPYNLYVAAFDDYTKELEYYINSSVENTPIQSSFETTQTAYYTQRTDILNKIAYEAKQYVINLNDSTKRSLTTKIEAVDGRITSEVKSVKEYADGVLKDSKIYTDSQFEILDGKITSQVTRSEFDALGNRVSNNESTISQQATEIESKVSSTDFNGNTIVSKINQTSTTATINAWHINLNGQVSFSSFDNSLKNDFNDKANSSDLGALAYLDSVNADIDEATMNKINGAMQEKTYINGGFLNTTYARVKTIEAVEGTIGEFKISSDILKARATVDYEYGDSGYIQTITATRTVTLSPGYLSVENNLGGSVIISPDPTKAPLLVENSRNTGTSFGNGSPAAKFLVGKTTGNTGTQVWIECLHKPGGSTSAYGWGSMFTVESAYFGDSYAMERTCINVGKIISKNQLKTWHSNANTFKQILYNDETGYLCYQI